MHFRHRGNNVQIVKTEMVDGKKKSVPVGSVNKLNLNITDALKSKATADELAEIEQWVSDFKSLQDLKAEVAALSLAEQMGLAAKWLESADKSRAAKVGNDILDALPLLRKAIVQVV